jgi:hypothetical protein
MFKKGDLVIHSRTGERPRVVLWSKRYEKEAGQSIEYLFIHRVEHSEIVGFPVWQFRLISPAPTGE